MYPLSPISSDCGQAGLAETLQFILGKFEGQTADRLAENVFVTGGLSHLPGLRPRLEKELQVSRDITQKNFKIKLAARLDMICWVAIVAELLRF